MKSKQLERFDSVKGDTFANAAKEAWECSSYAEWVVSLPQDEQPIPEEEE